MEKSMAIARVFKAGKSLAVELPEGFQLQGPDLEVFWHRGDLVLREKRQGLERAFEIIASMPEDVFDGLRPDAPPQVREDL